MRHLRFLPPGAAGLAVPALAALALAALSLTPLPASAQNANTEDVREQYARAIAYCNSVGWRFRNCVEARQVIEESCANNVLGFCELAAGIDLDGGGRGFPNRSSPGGVTVIEPSDAPPTALTPATPTTPAAPVPPAGTADGRNFDDVLQGLTN